MVSVAVHLRVAAQHQPDQQRRRRHRQHGGDQQQRGRQGDEPADERGAAVGVVAFGAGEHRHEDRGERRLQHQRRDQVGQLVGHREGAGQRRAEDGGEQHDADEPGDPADQCRDRHAPRPRHHRRVGQFGAAGASSRRRSAGQPRRWRRLPARRWWSGDGCAVPRRRAGPAGGGRATEVDPRRRWSRPAAPPSGTHFSPLFARAMDALPVQVASIVVEAQRDVERIRAVQVGAVGLTAEPVPQPAAGQRTRTAPTDSVMKNSTWP